MTPIADRPYFAAYLEIHDRLAVVVGGGAVAEGKAETLLRSGARVRVVSPALRDRLHAWTKHGAVEHRAHAYEPRDLDGAYLVVAATDDPAVNAAVAVEARKRGLLVNVADDPALSTFIMPAVIDRGPVQIGVSTGGASPVIATRIAALLSAAVPAGYGTLAAIARDFREAAKRRFADASTRRKFWERVVDGPIGRKAIEGSEEEARDLIEQELGEVPGRSPPNG